MTQPRRCCRRISGDGAAAGSPTCGRCDRERHSAEVRGEILKARRLTASAALLAAGLAVPAAAAPAGSVVAQLTAQTHWGETAGALLRQFGRAARLPWRLDFGDSYVDVVLPDLRIGGLRFIVFFQMDKKSGGLARIQIERPRHGANPPAVRAALAALAAGYGAPDRTCRLPPSPRNGYQAAVEEVWRRGAAAIRAIWRATTLEAAEGCFSLVEGGPCGLEGQLLIRISPDGRDAGACGRPRGGLPSRGGDVR
jgi:hypothetical protein